MRRHNCTIIDDRFIRRTGPRGLEVKPRASLVERERERERERESTERHRFSAVIAYYYKEKPGLFLHEVRYVWLVRNDNYRRSLLNALSRAPLSCPLCPHGESDRRTTFGMPCHSCVQRVWLYRVKFCREVPSGVDGQEGGSVSKGMFSLSRTCNSFFKSLISKRANKYPF